ncbi:MAG: glycoside hydrolase [Candidatus Marinimicrobia bacterium]|nr:glycoside hydrolase [Candidatus Neomarinimicrobiota bacterium]
MTIKNGVRFSLPDSRFLIRGFVFLLAIACFAPAPWAAAENLERAGTTGVWLEWSADKTPRTLAPGADLACPRPIATGDFVVELAASTADPDSLRLELQISADAYRIDGASGRLTCSSSEGIRTYLQKPLDVELAGGLTNRPFRLSVERRDNRVVVSWNGAEVYEAPYGRDTVGHVRVTVGSGSADLHAFRVAGLMPTLPEPVPVFVSGAEGSAYYRIPSLVRTPSGTLLAFAEARRESFLDTGNIDLILKRSEDGGRTWGEPELVYEEGGDRKVTCTNLSPVMDAITGRVWVFFLVCERWNVAEYKLMRMFSDDEGRTWSAPEDIRTTVGNEKWLSAHPGPGHGIQLARGPHAGRLIMSGWYYMDGQHGVFVFFSDDHGATWQRHEPVAVGPNETMLVELEDGGVMAMMRPQHRTQSVWREFATSKDGVHWTSARRMSWFRSVVCQASVLRHSWPAAGRPGRMIFCHPASGNYSDTSVHRAGLTIRSSFDDGETWPVKELLYPGRAAYSDITLFPDGSVGILFENGDLDTYGRISFMRHMPLFADCPSGKEAP